MIIQIPVKSSRGFGAITTGDIEREIKSRGIYVEEVPYPERRVIEPWLPEPLPDVLRLPETPMMEPWLPITLPEVEPLPETPVIEPWLQPFPDVLPFPETPVVVLPGEEGISPIVEPWLPQFPYLTEPELIEEYTPPFIEEDLFPLTPTEIPEPKAPSKAPLAVAVAVLAWAALTDGKKAKKAKKVSNSGKPNEGG